MKIAVDLSALRGAQWHQYALRFALGGAVTVLTGWIAQAFGPVFGGLFLAFPAIFPAGATLIAQRERQKKTRQGLHGAQRGRRAAALDAAGAVLGAIGLMGFAMVAWQGLPSFPPALALSVALLGWLAISLPLWWLRKKHNRR
jgi:hypothetical protein